MKKRKTAAKRLDPVNREGWRAWLEQNHPTEKEIWLVQHKKHTGQAGLSYEDAVEEALCFGWIDGLVKSVDADKYLLRFTPRQSRSIWSETNKKRVARLIRQGRMTEAGLARIEEAKENGEWDKATLREDTTRIPPELEKALRSNRKAREHLAKLAPSYKKQFFWWIASAKTEITRQKRVRDAVRLLEQNKRLGIANG